MDDLQSRELLADTGRAVPGLGVPLHTAGLLVGSGRTRRHGAAGRGAEESRNGALRRRHEDRRPRHPARKVRLEAQLVDVARAVLFAFRLEHDVRIEERVGGGEQASCAVSPFRVLGIILQDGGAVEEDAHIVAPLVVVDVGAALGVVRAIVHIVVLIHQPDGLDPVKGLLGPTDIVCVTGEASKAGGELEEETVGDGVLVVEAGGRWGDFPLHPAVAGGRVPPGAHLGEDILC